LNVIFKKHGALLLKILIFGLTSFYLYQAAAGPDKWLALLKQQNKDSTWFYFGLAALLIPINWGMEALKWYLLARKLEEVSFSRAFRAVMVGLTLGFITPNRVGDYAGRILELKSKRRNDAIGAIFLGRFSQLIATILAGSFGCYYLLWRFYLHGFPFVKVSLGLGLLILYFLVLLFYFQPKILFSWLLVFRKLRKYLHYVRIVTKYSFPELARLLALAFGRYFVFCLQFVFLLRAFDVYLPVKEYAAGIAGTFLLKSIVPSLSALTDIGMREITAMHFFELFGKAPLAVLSASLSLWFLNIALPSAVGLIFVLRLKFKRLPE
jgi:hypothetical protein